MQILINSLSRFYSLLLWLYPASFRAEYGEELRAIFNLRMQEAARRGRVALFFCGLRELVSLPVIGFMVAIALLPAAMLLAQATGGSITNLILGIGGVSVLVLVIVYAVKRLDLRRFIIDWTLVSFIGYGGALLLLSSSFEGYQGEGLVQCMATLALAGGAWFFVRTDSRFMRVATLAMAASIATLVIALGKVWLINHGMVADWLQGSWLVDVLGTLALGSIALAAILGPAVLNWLPVNRIRGMG